MFLFLFLIRALKKSISMNFTKQRLKSDVSLGVTKEESVQNAVKNITKCWFCSLFVSW